MTGRNGHHDDGSKSRPSASGDGGREEGGPEGDPEGDGHEEGGSEEDGERTRVTGKDFTGTRVLLDGKHFEDCRFETCTLVYRGGVPPNFVRCDFAAPQFAFEEAAKHTVQLMSAIYHGIDERIIERTFDEIRKGFGDRP
jgi:hypothetical protein